MAQGEGPKFKPWYCKKKKVEIIGTTEYFEWEGVLCVKQWASEAGRVS
jgi:hypothetical protein